MTFIKRLLAIVQLPKDYKRRNCDLCFFPLQWEKISDILHHQPKGQRAIDFRDMWEVDTHFVYS